MDDQASNAQPASGRDGEQERALTNKEGPLAQPLPECHEQKPFLDAQLNRQASLRAVDQHVSAPKPYLSVAQSGQSQNQIPDQTLPNTAAARALAVRSGSSVPKETAAPSPNSRAYEFDKEQPFQNQSSKDLKAEEPVSKQAKAKAPAHGDPRAKPQAANNGADFQAVLIKRRSAWSSSVAAARYVRDLAKDDDVRVRDSDRATSIFLLISCAFVALSLIVPAMMPLRIYLIGGCDLIVGVVLVLYVIHRFGILSTLTPRQALLAWQLIMGATFLGVFFTVNLALLISLSLLR